MKEIIKKYLEGCCQTDPYFKEKYNESQLDKCVEFITDMAKERANGSNCVNTSKVQSSKNTTKH